MFVFNSKYVDNCGNLIFNTSFSCSEDSLMFFLIRGDYSVILIFRKNKSLLLMDKVLLARRWSSSLFPLQYSCCTTDKFLVIHEPPSVRMHSAMWTQISSQLWNYVSWQALVEEKHLATVEAEESSGLQAKQNKASSQISGCFTFS